MWSFHDRMQESITVENCADEIASLGKHGQLVPALGRTLCNDPRHEIELIFGSRRLFVAQHLNIPIRVELRDVSDREGVILMDTENRLRRDVSAYERGVSYTRWLRDRFFSSQDEIADALKISASQVSRLLKLAKLPAVIVSAFAHPADICERWGLELLDAMEDPQRRERIVRRAREIAREKSNPDAAQVSRRLLAGVSSGKRGRSVGQDEIVQGSQGNLLFRVRHSKNTLMILVPNSKIDRGTVLRIRSSLRDILQGDGNERLGERPRSSDSCETSA
jgi:ParB family chromosome partitioning protein